MYQGWKVVDEVRSDTRWTIDALAAATKHMPTKPANELTGKHRAKMGERSEHNRYRHPHLRGSGRDRQGPRVCPRDHVRNRIPRREPGDPADILLTTAGFFWQTAESKAAHGLDPKRTLHAEQEYVFHGEPPRAGRVLTASAKVTDRYRKEGRRGGALTFVKIVTVFRDENGRLVADSARPPSRPRGLRRRNPDDHAETRPAITVGDAAPARTFGPITVTDIVRYAGASGDFNPLHHDDEAAKGAGFAGVFSIGMFQAALLATFAAMAGASKCAVTTRFKEQVWPGDELVCTGEVIAVEPDGGGSAVTVALAWTRRAPVFAIDGSAEFWLPA